MNTTSDDQHWPALEKDDALEWADVVLERRQIRVRHSDWCGELTAPKKG